jgi:hypothetical protein
MSGLIIKIENIRILYGQNTQKDKYLVISFHFRSIVL